MKNFYTEDVFETSSRRIGKHEMFHGQMFVVFIQFSAQERLIFLKKRLVILLRIFKNNLKFLTCVVFENIFRRSRFFLVEAFPLGHLQFHLIQTIRSNQFKNELLICLLKLCVDIHLHLPIGLADEIPDIKILPIDLKQPLNYYCFHQTTSNLLLNCHQMW